MGEVFLLILILIMLISVIYHFQIQSKSHHEIEQDGNQIEIFLKDSERLISSNLSKAKKLTQKSISKSYLIGCTWILLNNEDNEDILYTFRSNDELLITINGIVERCQYELIVDNNSILITKNSVTELYNIINDHNEFLFLNRVSSQKILAFANYTKYKDELKSNIKLKAKDFFDF